MMGVKSSFIEINRACPTTLWLLFLVLLAHHQVVIYAQDINLLFIIFDDLRPDLECYGRDYMVTPNFNRLAKRSVVFEQAHCQVAVCNPSRNSLLTGLRPDTRRDYNFQGQIHRNLIFPSHLVKSNYSTAAFGKIRHWEDRNRQIWSNEGWDNGWYEYQAFEGTMMNSSVMPDRYRKEKEFRDYQFTSKAITKLRFLSRRPKPFMLAVGYKLPHLALHVPYKYYAMYRNKTESWKLSKKQLKFPSSVSEVSYRCCAALDFDFMREEGAAKSNRSYSMVDINSPTRADARDEIMMAYSAAISFLDRQLGRLLDEVDRLQLWSNLTVVLTADHGMNNGEKGMW